MLAKMRNQAVQHCHSFAAGRLFSTAYRESQKKICQAAVAKELEEHRGSAVPEEMRQESIVFSCFSSELLGSIHLLTKQVVKVLN